ESCGWLLPAEVEHGKCPTCGKDAQVGRVEKMSKSIKNVVDPEKLIEAYGADTARLFCLFAAPPELDLAWSEKGVEGSYRFIQRVWRLVTENMELLRHDAPADWSRADDPEVKALRRKTHQTIKKVTEDIEKRFHFNTAISAVMELVNQLYQFDITKGAADLRAAAFREALTMTVLLLSPMVPHMCEELWQQMGNSGGITHEPWPEFDPHAVKADEMEIAIQVNGKLRGKARVSADASEEAIKETALACEQIFQWVQGKTIVKVIVAPGRQGSRLVSVVVKGKD
ncbi:MAG: class I tRNA ligase family protein, partial [Pseudomonadota bacterium]